MADRPRSSRILDPPAECSKPFLRARDEPTPTQAEAAPATDPLADAHRRGREQGLREGREAARVEYEHALEALRGETAASLQQLARLHERLVDELHAAMIELALQAATRIVRERVAGDDPVAARALAEAVEGLPAGDTVRARVHPDDLESIQRALEEDIERQRIELQADPSVARGGCFVDSAAGVIDATLDTAEAEIRNAATGEADAS